MTRRVTSASFAILIAALFLAFSAPAQQTAAQSARAKKLGNQVKCMCGGCNDAAGSCYHSGGTFSGPCPMALDMLKKVDAHVANNDSDSATLNAFVQEYGPLVLIEPPKSGFNLAAWIMPIAVPLVAFFAVWEVVRRWRHRAALTPTAGPGAPAVAHDLLERVRSDAEKDDA
jgi:cytochrome c-type biogenesis protein CcmH